MIIYIFCIFSYLVVFCTLVFLERKTLHETPTLTGFLLLIAPILILSIILVVISKVIGDTIVWIADFSKNFYV